jgi:hypothetical protein
LTDYKAAAHTAEKKADRLHIHAPSGIRIPEISVKRIKTVRIASVIGATYLLTYLLTHSMVR